MFCDITPLTLTAGNGGNGSLSFRREKYIPYGGPNGGDGGKGGDVIFVTNPHKYSLIDQYTRKHYEAEHGENGMGSNKHGKSGEDLRIEVPVGTIIRDADTYDIIADLNKEYMEYVLLVGGRGGYGNAHFKSSTRQAPKFAELGEPGNVKDVVLELRLVADIGLIGKPNAGKSSLLSVLTEARPKVADYPFTTLSPNLGVCSVHDDAFTIADIPGIIEGASEGKGLGHEFLRHVSRNAALVHVVDLNAENIAKDIEEVLQEITLYDSSLLKMPRIVVVSKCDEYDEELFLYAKESIQKSGFTGVILPCSSFSLFGIPELKQVVYDIVQQRRALIPQEVPVVERLYTPLIDDPYAFRVDLVKVRKKEDGEKKYFCIAGKRINQIAIMTNFEQDQGVERLYDVLVKMGIDRQLQRMGAQYGDVIQFERFSKTLVYRDL